MTPPLFTGEQATDRDRSGLSTGRLMRAQGRTVPRVVVTRRARPVIGPGSAYSNRPPQPLRQGKNAIFAERVQRPFIKDVTICQGAEVLGAWPDSFPTRFPTGCVEPLALGPTTDETD
jgi:hypothetical protein